MCPGAPAPGCGASRPHAPTRGRVRCGLDGSGLGLALDGLLQAADQLRLAAACVAAAHREQLAQLDHLERIEGAIGREGQGVHRWHVVLRPVRIRIRARARARVGVRVRIKARERVRFRARVRVRVRG